MVLLIQASSQPTLGPTKEKKYWQYRTTLFALETLFLDICLNTLLWSVWFTNDWTVHAKQFILTCPCFALRAPCLVIFFITEVSCWLNRLPPLNFIFFLFLREPRWDVLAEQPQTGTCLADNVYHTGEVLMYVWSFCLVRSEDSGEPGGLTWTRSHSGCSHGSSFTRTRLMFLLIYLFIEQFREDCHWMNLVVVLAVLVVPATDLQDWTMKKLKICICASLNKTHIWVNSLAMGEQTKLNK